MTIRTSFKPEKFVVDPNVRVLQLTAAVGGGEAVASRSCGPRGSSRSSGGLSDRLASAGTRLRRLPLADVGARGHSAPVEKDGS